jgi:hypothetical protein
MGRLIVRFDLTNRTRFDELKAFLASLDPHTKSEWLRQAALEKMRGAPITEQIESLATQGKQEHQEQTALLQQILAQVKRTRKKK